MVKIPKQKNSVLPQKETLKKKKLSEETPLLKKVASTASSKKLVLPDVEDAAERNEWKKEKREYWSGRFRRVLADIAVRPKVKKSSFF